MKEKNRSRAMPVEFWNTEISITNRLKLVETDGVMDIEFMDPEIMRAHDMFLVSERHDGGERQRDGSGRRREVSEDPGGWVRGRLCSSGDRKMKR